MKDFEPAIAAATSFIDRFKAVEFVMSVKPYSDFVEVRRKRAITYAIERSYHAIDFTDAEAEGGVVVRRGGYDAPIFTCHLGGDLAGALVCSCVVPGLPTRIMMLAISEAHRGMGIAQALVLRAAACASVIGVAPPDDEIAEGNARLKMEAHHG